MSTKYIDSIRSIEDFRRIPENELDCLAAEIRECGAYHSAATRL